MRVWSMISGIALGACSVVGIRSGTEQPPYQVVTHVGPVEVRHYAARIAAETVVPGGEEDSRSAGFRRLAGYIFGANHARAEIAMTAPVAQANARSETIAMTAPVAQAVGSSGNWQIRFFMPAKYTLEKLPTPDDPTVKLVSVPPETMAVYRFSGSTGAASIAEARRVLLSRLDGSGWKALAEPVAWFYDPPWTLPPLRRNEVAVPVERAS